MKLTTEKVYLLIHYDGYRDITLGVFKTQESAWRYAEAHLFHPEECDVEEYEVMS